MQIIASTLDSETSDRLLTGIVVLWLIAWVLTRSRHRNLNLAPLSTFAFVAPKPSAPLTVGHKAGIYKDLVRNILETELSTNHIAETSQATAAHHSAI